MKAISTNHNSMFFNAAVSSGSLTSPWSTPFQSETRDTERAARRQLRRSEKEDGDFSELAARAVLAITMVSAYATAIWQIAGF